MIGKDCFKHLQKKKVSEPKSIEAKTQAPVKSKTNKKLREVFGWVLYIGVIISIIYFIPTYVGQRTLVVGDSMLNTLHNQDNLIIDKITYRFKEPERYDIVVFPYQYAEDTYYIKRIIGLPGETVQIKEGYVYINDEKLEESYGREVIEAGKYGIAAQQIQLGEEEYFVLGDNRNNSTDSRSASVGILHRDDFIGKVCIRIWPLDRVGIISK